MKTNYWFALLALLAVAPAVRPVSAAETAVTKDDNVNVRGQPSFVGEIITRLKKGEEVTVLEDITVEKPKPGEPGHWVKIGMPANTPVWVFSPFIDPGSGTVIPKKLNLRAGPGENYSVVGRLDRGASIKEIRRKDEWIEIEMPPNTYAFVAAELLDRKGAHSSPATFTGDPSQKPASELRSVEGPTRRQPAATDSAPAEPIPKTESHTPAPTEARPEASVKLPASDPPLVAQPPEAATTNLVARSTLFIPDPTPPPRRIVRREGIVGGTVSIKAPSHFELDSLESGETIEYLFTTSTNIPLKTLKGQKVFVMGEEYIDKRWPKTPVLEVESFEIIDSQ
jgi:uncharacterized protein YgiM (DUF1202 family)